jgi:hypothetical protein
MMGGPKTSALSIVSLVLGILSLLSSCCCGLLAIPFSIGAIVCGIIGISKANASPQEVSGKGLAIGGIATGAVAIVVGIVMFALGMAGQIFDQLK